MRILVTGGSGFIGSAIVKKLSTRNHEVIVLTRNVAKASKLLGKEPNVEFCSILDQIPSSSRLDCIINLAGARIAEMPWTMSRKNRLINSRTSTTNGIISLIKRLKIKPKKLISASAIGWYGSTDNDIRVTEQYQNFNDSFSHRMCNEWEKTAQEAADYGVNVNIIRLGMVLGGNGGILKKFLPFFKLGLGFYFGNGEHHISWIHINDVTSGIMFLMNNNTKDLLYNFTAPIPVSNKIFSQQLSKNLNRPLWIKIPKYLVSVILGDLGRELLLTNIYAVPQNLLDAGFQFERTNINQAFENLAN